MELSSLVSRQVPNLSGGAGINTRSSQPLFPGDAHFPGRKAFGASRLRTRMRAMNSGFDDYGHVFVEYYYNSGSRSAAGNKKVKEIKKKLKGVPDTNDGVGTDDAGSGIDDSDTTGAAGVEVDTGAAGIEDVMDSEEEGEVDVAVEINFEGLLKGMIDTELEN